MIVKYDSNNSGGSWWLKDDDWKKLEDAGWKVEWYNKEKPDPNCEYCEGTGKITKNILKNNTMGLWSTKDIGKRCFRCLHDENGRFLGALATKASKDFSTVKDALEEFEKITGQQVSDEGCSCCGPPHSFDWEDDKSNFNYCSGEGCLEYLYPDKEIPKTLRDAVEKCLEPKGIKEEGKQT